MMTQSLNGSRKRVRGNRDEEGSELPLSKRIHNLRINNGNGLGHPLPKHPQANNGNVENTEQWLTQESGPSGMSSEGLGLQQQIYIQNEAEHERLSVQEQHSQLYLGNGADTSNNPESWLPNHVLPQYSPDLDASDNPFYYENNKLLYDLYVERMQRCGMI